MTDAVATSRSRASHGKIGRLAAAMAFRIATGRPKPGERAASVREAAAEWGVSPVTALRVYRRLEEQGLLESRPRSGFYVRQGPDIDRLAQPSSGVRTLYERVRRVIEQESDAAPLAVFRLLAQMAEAKAASDPEVAFVECTLTQATGHAREVQRRLGIVCAALTTDQCLVSGPPKSVRTLLTTVWHAREIAHLHDPPRRRVLRVPVSRSGEFVRRLHARARSIFILCLQPGQGEQVASDIRDLWSGRAPIIEVRRAGPARIDAMLRDRLGCPESPTPGRACILSLTNYEAASRTWMRSGAVFPFTYTIAEDAWARIEEVTGFSPWPSLT